MRIEVWNPDRISLSNIRSSLFIYRQQPGAVSQQSGGADLPAEFVPLSAPTPDDLKEDIAEVEKGLLQVGGDELISLEENSEGGKKRKQRFYFLCLIINLCQNDPGAKIVVQVGISHLIEMFLCFLKSPGIIIQLCQVVVQSVFPKDVRQGGAISLNEMLNPVVAAKAEGKLHDIGKGPWR